MTTETIVQASTRTTHYKLEHGVFGHGECYRLTIDHNALIAFDEASFYGGMIGLSRDGEQKTTLSKKHQLPSKIKLKLREIADEEGGSDE